MHPRPFHCSLTLLMLVLLLLPHMAAYGHHAGVASASPIVDLAPSQCVPDARPAWITAYPANHLEPGRSMRVAQRHLTVGVTSTAMATRLEMAFRAGDGAL